MAVITLPPLAANSMGIRLIRADTPLKFFGGGEVIIASTEALWVVTFQLRPEKPGANGRDWFATLTQLSNLENTCKVSAAGLEIGSGYSGANPVVNGAGQSGLTLAVDGASNTTLIGLKGDPFEVDGQYKILTADATTNGSGAVTLAFEPALRASPSNGGPVDIKTPQLTTRLVAPIAELDTLLGGFYNMTVTLVETYRP